MTKLLLSALILLASSAASAKEMQDHNRMMDHGDGHLMDMAGGMVMGQNTDTLPGGCDSISSSKEITVHAGHKYAEKFPGRIFAFDKQEYQFEPCTKLTVHFINDDDIRHQWMMHGLPRYLYPKGMFHMEVTGRGKITGTLIFPPGDKTYLVHCDMAQHMEKGMKGQLKIGKGSGDLPSIPGVTAFVIQDSYKNAIPPVVEMPVTKKDRKAAANKSAVKTESESFISGMMVIGLAVGLLAMPYLMRKFKGMTSAEIVAYIIGLVKQLVVLLVGFVTNLDLMRKFKGMTSAEIVAYIIDLAKQLVALLVDLVTKLIAASKKALPEK